MQNFLSFLNGKKVYILAICALIIGYLSTTGVITGQLATLILAILNLLGGGAQIATARMISGSMTKGTLRD